MNYLKKVEESIKFTWKYKTLWIFGAIVSIFGGGGFFNSPGNFSSDQNSQVADKVEEISESPTAIVLIIVFSIIALILAVIGWYLNSVAKAALINSVRVDDAGGRPTFKEGWKFGRTLALRIMWMDVIGFGISLTIIIPILLVVILGILFPPFFILFCLLIPLVILLGVLWVIVYTGALRYLVLKDLSAWDSLVSGWNLAKSTIVEYIVGGLVSLLTGCIWAVVLIPLAIISVIFFILLVAMTLLINPILAVLILIIGLLLGVLAMALVNAPYAVFTNTYWTKVVMTLMEKFEK